MKTAFIIGLLFMSSVAFAQESPFSEKPAQGTTNDPVRVELGSRPVPDPTALTASAINALREELRVLWEQKFSDLQSQVTRLLMVQDKMPVDIRTEITNLDRLVNEKFKGLVDQQIQRDNNLALALTAAQKSVTDTNQSNITAANKAEQSFKDQIAATQLTITDLKDRITRIESGSAGSGSAVNWIFAGIAAFATLIGAVFAIIAFLKPAPTIAPLPLPVVQYNNPTGGKKIT